MPDAGELEVEEPEDEEPEVEDPDGVESEVEEPDVEEPEVEELDVEEPDVEEPDVEELDREVELSLTASSDADESDALQALRNSVALAARRVMAIRPDGSENLE